MTRLRIWILRLLGSVLRARGERDLEREIAFHLDMETSRQEQLGANPDLARQQALRSFGGVNRTKDLYRHQRGLASLEDFVQDVRYAIRAFLSIPGFSFVAIASLAVTIGANTAIFSAVNSLLIQAPYPHADRLVQLIPWNQRTQEPVSVSLADVNDWRSTNIFSDIAVTRETMFALTGVGDPQTIFGGTVTPNFFRVLGIAPQVGRDFATEEQRAVIISDGLWRKRFGGASSTLGQTMTLNGIPWRIVGIAPKDFRSPSPLQEVWAAAMPAAGQSSNRSAPGGAALARLRPDVSLSTALEVLQAIADRVAKDYPQTNTDIGIRVVRQHDYEIELMGLRPLLVALSVAGVIVLGVCWINLSNLLLVRSSWRSGEFALRTAVGATRARLTQQVLIESLVLGSFGGVLGLLMGLIGTRLLGNPPGFYLLYLRYVRTDLAMFAFTGILSITGVFAFGMIPALLTPRVAMGCSLTSGTRGNTQSRGSERLRQILLVCQIAACAGLVILTAAVSGSVTRLTNVALGYKPAGVLHVRIGNTQRQYRTNQEWTPVYWEVIRRISGLPGVLAVGGANGVPHGGEAVRPVVLGNEVYRSPADAPSVRFRVIGGGYLAAMGIALKEGRDLTAADTANSQKVVLINEAMRRRYWPSASPLGQPIRIGELDTDGGFHLDGPAALIVGVTADVRQSETLVEAPAPAIYVPFEQSPTRELELMIRTAGNPLILAPALRREIRGISTQLVVDRIETMEDRVREATGVPRFALWLMAVLSTIALALTIVGMYGAIAYWVTTRKKEIGIRMALGARQSEIAAVFVKRAGVLCAVGLSIGTAIGIVLTQRLKEVAASGWLTESLTFGVGHFDARPILASWVVITVGVMVGIGVPIRRVSKLDSLTTMRID